MENHDHPGEGLRPIRTDLEALRERVQASATRPISRTKSSPPSRRAQQPASPAAVPPAANITTCACKGSGFLVADVPYGHPDFGKLIPCICTQEARRTRQAQQSAWRLAQLRTELGSMADCSFDDFDLRRPLRPFKYRGATYPLGTQRRTLAEARAAGLAFASTLADDTEPSAWFYCYGPVGGGKSHLAAAIANYAAAIGLETSYASVPRFLRFIKSGFRQIAEDNVTSEADQRILALMNVPVLVLDDLGQEQLSKWDRTTLFEIFDARYRHKLPTIITSNLHLEDLERHHEPVADRIRGMTHATRVGLIVCSIREGADEAVRAS